MASPQASIQLSNGYAMPILGLGTWQAENETEVETAIRAAIDVGYRHIDTAYVYKNEHYIGRILKKIVEEGKVKRSDLFIVSKLPLNGHRNVEYFCKKSLAALQLDYIDLYLIHVPISTIRTDDDDDFMPMKDGKILLDNSNNVIETWKAMEELVDKGLTRSIGISNFNSKQIQRVIENSRIKPVSLQVECHVFLPQYELHDLCKKYNISFTAYSPLGSPGLADWCKKKYGADYKLPSMINESKVKEISEKHKKTSAQVLLRYLIQRDIIVIPKSSNPKRIKENFEVFDFHLSDEDMKALKAVQNGFRYFKFEEPNGLMDHPEHPFHEPY